MAYHSSHARTTGKHSAKMVSAAKKHVAGSKKGALPNAAGMTMSGPSDRYPGATGQLGTSGGM